MGIKERNIPLIWAYFVLAAVTLATPLYYAIASQALTLTRSSVSLMSTAWLLGALISAIILKPHSAQEDYTMGDVLAWSISGPLPLLAYLLTSLHLRIFTKKSSK